MSENKQTKRVFKTPIIASLSVIMVIAIHFGYILFSISGIEQNTLSSLSKISFEVLLLSEVGILTIIFHNKGKVDAFLRQYPTITRIQEIEELKPILRTNMYSALLTVFFLAIGCLTAVMTITHDSFIFAVITGVLCAAAAKAINWYNISEEKLKQIECTNPLIEKELEKIYECWLQKALPDF